MCRLPELSAVRHREHSPSAQPHHPEASRPSEHMQQPQGEQLVQKLQQKLQGQADTSGPTPADAALAAIQPQTDHHSIVKQHHKGSHAHFADDDSNALDDGFAERNESITAVRGAARGDGGSHAEGTFWTRLDAEGSSVAATGWCSYGQFILKWCPSSAMVCKIYCWFSPLSFTLLLLHLTLRVCMAVECSCKCYTL